MIVDTETQARLLDQVGMSKWNALAKFLGDTSIDICKDNDCDIDHDKHNCESYAYISADGMMHDICYPDYWQGWGADDIAYHGNIAAIPLPWHGHGQDLKSAVDNDLPWD